MANIPWLADVLRGAGIEVVEQGDWHNRYHAGAFEPFGVLWHHTAGAPSSPSNPHPSLDVVINAVPTSPARSRRRSSTTTASSTSYPPAGVTTPAPAAVADRSRQATETP